MSDPRALVAGNWKMNLDHVEAIHLTQQLGVLLRTVEHEHVDVLVLPPATNLRSVGSVIEADRLALTLGAQHVSQFEAGAYTGEISAAMLRRLGASYVLVGHSERRQMFHMDDAVVAATLDGALRGGLRPIVCVGESAGVREAAEHASFVTAQVHAALSGREDVDVVIAYEPVWAIGTGATATVDQIAEMSGIIRNALPSAMRPGTRILYGGSVNSANAEEIARHGDVNGFLVGGASLKADEFVQIVALASDCYAKSR